MSTNAATIVDDAVVTRVRFVVDGVAAPQGSKSASLINGRIVMRESSKRVKPWRNKVWRLATLAMDGNAPMSGPVEMRAEFRLPRPKAHRGARGIRRAAPQYPTTYPDLSKLIRAIEDAMTGVVWDDDSQVVHVDAWKFYDDVDVPSVSIDVRAHWAETHGDWLDALADGASES